MDMTSTGASAPDEKSGVSLGDEILTPKLITGGGGAPPSPTRSGGGPFSGDLDAEADFDTCAQRVVGKWFPAFCLPRQGE